MSTKYKFDVFSEEKKRKEFSSGGNKFLLRQINIFIIDIDFYQIGNCIIFLSHNFIVFLSSWLLSFSSFSSFSSFPPPFLISSFFQLLSVLHLLFSFALYHQNAALLFVYFNFFLVLFFILFIWQEFVFCKITEDIDLVIAGNPVYLAVGNTVILQYSAVQAYVLEDRILLL